MENIGDYGVGVPSELIEGATQVPEAASGMSRAGPADAVAGRSPDEDEPIGELEGHAGFRDLESNQRIAGCRQSRIVRSMVCFVWEHDHGKCACRRLRSSARWWV